MGRGDLQPDQLQNNDVSSIDSQLESVVSTLIPMWIPTQVQEKAVAFAMEKFSLNKTIESK